MGGAAVGTPGKFRFRVSLRSFAPFSLATLGIRVAQDDNTRFGLKMTTSPIPRAIPRSPCSLGMRC